MNEKILIIDDMELNREMLAAILEGEYGIVQAKKSCDFAFCGDLFSAT